MRRPDWEPDYVEFFVARAPALRRTAYTMCGDWQVAEDLVQTTFVRLYVHWSRVRPETADAYARRIMTNLFLTGRRHHSRELVTDVVPEHAASSAVADVAGSRVDIAAALAALPARQRVVVALRYVDDLPISEVAELLGLAEGTVKSHCARAIEALRAALAAPQTARGGQ